MEIYCQIVVLQAPAPEERDRSAQINERSSKPLKTYLLSEIIPLISKLLIQACESRPEDAVQFIAEHLMEEADKQDNSIVDPYDSEIYLVQEQKIADKAAREEERRLEAIAKAERSLGQHTHMHSSWGTLENDLRPMPHFVFI